MLYGHGFSNVLLSSSGMLLVNIIDLLWIVIPTAFFVILGWYIVRWIEPVSEADDEYGYENWLKSVKNHQLRVIKGGNGARRLLVDRRKSGKRGRGSGSGNKDLSSP